MRKKNNFIILLILTVVCAILIIATSLDSAAVMPMKNTVSTILTPLQSVVSRLGQSADNALREKRSYEEILEQNKKLEATIDDLIAENTRLEIADAELDRLRDLYRLDKDYGKYEKVGARVIAKDSVGWFNEFKIDKGEEDGLAVDMNVIADGGLIGIICEVGPNYSRVRSIIDDSSRISAMSVPSNDSCIVLGNLETYQNGRLLIQDIAADAEVTDGNKIVTSNVSSKFLPGILIGYAIDITMDSNNLTKSGYLIPAADFQKLQEVLVITSLKQQ